MKLKTFVAILALLLVAVLGITMFTACGSSEDDGEDIVENDGDNGEEAGEIYEQDFHITNNTGATIHELNVSASDKDTWDPDLLGGDSIEDGSGATVTFGSEVTARYWDIRVKDVNGNGIYFRNVDLFEVSEVTLTIQDGEGVATVS